MLPEIPNDWNELLKGETSKEYYVKLNKFLAEEIKGNVVLPTPDCIFQALRVTPYKNVKALLLGQDPYPTPGHAHGLCFSVRPEVRPLPGSLRNIYKELSTDIPGFAAPSHGSLKAWAGQGVLMLNTVLTVRAHAPNSHQKRGWEQFTDKIIELLNAKSERVVFVLWGNKAQEKRKLITGAAHAVVATAHPSPLSVKRFLGSKPFSQVNQLLAEAGRPPIDWHLPREV